MMTSENSEDQEVFEITDFTTVTEWERFIARIEQVIHEWSLATISPVGFAPLQKGELAQGEWQQISKEIVFSNFKFTMIRCCLKQTSGIDEGLPNSPVEGDDDVVPKALGDMMDSGSDFPPQVHCLAQWYGLRDFVTISPSTSDAITSESKAKLLLSAVAIALNNTNCSIPMFVQIHPKAQQYFIGLCIGGGFRTDFAMVHLRKAPQYANNLTGLLDVFKSKLNSAVPLSPIMVSVRFTYMLDDWSGSCSAWHNLLSGQEPFSFDPSVEFEDITTFLRLRFGAQSDPVCAFYLSATWPSLSEDVIVESDVACDLNPLEAPYWLLHAQINEFSEGFMGDYLHKFLQLCESYETVQQLLKGRISDDDIAYSEQIASALDRLAKPGVLSSISRVVQPPPLLRKKSAFGLGEGPIKHSLLFLILRYLFPDADPQDNRPYPTAWRHVVPVAEEWECVQDMLQGCKSAPFDSLVWRLGTILAHCMCSLGGLPAVAHLWHEFILELRYRWELGYPIPGLETGVPNLGCSLLYQKLQMLNCCIFKKRARENADSTSESHTDEEDINVDDEDEFFECSEEEPPPRQQPVTHSLWNQPEGRLRKYKNYTLLSSDEPLYIPITQEPSPMTEDLLEEQTEVLVKLGTDAQGAELRARMQSACLLSDMESFKAANPGSVLEDFVRWYSPRDWIEGHLSARMQLPGNMWADVWESAKPVPARRQKRLFDDTREGEKVLHHLSGLSIGKVACMSLPCLGQQAVIRLMEEGTPLTTPGLTPILQQAAEKLVKCTRDPKLKFNKYKEVLSLISSGEFLIVQGLSLISKLTPEPAIGECVEGEELERLVSYLIDKPEVPLKGASRGSAGKVIHHLFMEAQKKANLVIGGSVENIPSTVRDFPPPVIREYILRTPCHRPAPYSNPSPQRMYATITKDSFRIAAGLTQHNTFT